MTRLVPAVVSIALVAAVALPVVRDPVRGDSFPLSTYPMFAQPVRAPVILDRAVGATASEAPHALAPELVGTAEPLEALAIVELAVARGAAAQRALCEAIAARVAADPALADLVAVRIVTGQYDPIAFVLYGAAGYEVERTRCTVNR